MSFWAGSLKRSMLPSMLNFELRSLNSHMRDSLFLSSCSTAAQTTKAYVHYVCFHMINDPGKSHLDLTTAYLLTKDRSRFLHWESFLYCLKLLFFWGCCFLFLGGNTNQNSFQIIMMPSWQGFLIHKHYQ